MKTKHIVPLILAVSMAFSACCGSKTSSMPDGGKILSAEQIKFPKGQLVKADRFIGNVYLQTMIQNDKTYNFPQTNSIVFEPGARSSWHRHGGMIVIAAEGVGYYQEEGKKAQILRKGDIVEIPAGVKHWHGAAPDSWFSQIVIYDSAWKGQHEDGGIQHVSDKDYKNLQTEEYAGRTKNKNGNLMFSRAEKSFDSPNFNGPVYVSNLVGDKNAAGAPGLHYVAFAPGTINSWHIHAGGQVLIATDGIGYHQLPGQPVQVMRPGDVALCPPGVKHWHGGSADTEFAHIAANANPDKPGVEWLDRISEEEYKLFPNWQLVNEKLPSLPRERIQGDGLKTKPYPSPTRGEGI